ncbi:50S ribosomal protein L29 [Patescibacteria group bacterium]|nr:50S ribosomal protein L29 [Patescibacteria group bacterium]HOM78349.1 50S ribosomal protein L29 [bacterium]
MLARDLQKKEVTELNKLAQETKSKLVQARSVALEGKSADLLKIRTLKKDYARIRTVISQKLSVSVEG